MKKIVSFHFAAFSKNPVDYAQFLIRANIKRRLQEQGARASNESHNKPSSIRGSQLPYHGLQLWESGEENLYMKAVCFCTTVSNCRAAAFLRQTSWD